MQITEMELQKLIKEVETEFTAHLAKTEAEVAAQPETSLVKAEGNPFAKKDEKKEEKPAEEKPAEKPAEEKPAEKPAEEKSSEAPAEKPAEEKPAEEKSSEVPAEKPAEEKPAEAQANPEERAYDDEDMEQMHKMYGSMSKNELMLHHDSCRAALDKCGAMSKSEETATAVEVNPDIIKTNAELEIAKSEVITYKTKSEELQKSLDLVQALLTQLVKKAPQGKAITSLDYVAKSENTSEVKELSKSEITAILTKKTADPTLAKSDREAINEYYINGLNINKISHLLK